jgi:hypothetical protein
MDSGATREDSAMTEKKVEAIPAFQLTDLHPDHEKHLCHIAGLRNMRTVGTLAKDAQYVCVICGRAAKNAINLCEPAKI